MKKLILSAAILLGTMTAIATPTEAAVQNNAIENIQDEFTEVATDALPDAVNSTITNSFPGAKLEKAYTNEQKEYKLEISMSDKMYTIYTDAEGIVIKK
ncbi:hypothetical protein [Flavobacterium sp. 7A]|uniref:hypothetical protein n=1 Tax=Flavobacterium sp. 7A TaxID=2940571 RepID=UPI0022270E41|nr:hypothetical protein [Flavobacterium sp. 7A]MCW2121171.1 ABC-type proline/glycine betaine transport system substrate-binding protein [Flavobacterium sp. 7A]